MPDVEVKPPITSDPPATITPPAPGSSAAAGASAGGTGGEGGEDQSTWFVPGKYKTEKDALKNVVEIDKRIGGISSKIDQIEKMLSKPATAGATAAAPSGSQVNPATGKAWTQDEVLGQWNDWMQTNPVEATLALFDLMMGQSKGQLTNETRAALTWDTFIAANPEMASEENRKMLTEVIQSYPRLASKPDCLIKAKEIVLSAGDDIEEKYENWLHSRKNGKGKLPKGEDPPAIPGQGGISKGGGNAPANPFFTNKDGSSIFG